MSLIKICLECHHRLRINWQNPRVMHHKVDGTIVSDSPRLPLSIVYDVLYKEMTIIIGTQFLPMLCYLMTSGF